MKEKFLNALQDKDFSELFKKGGLSFLIRIGGQVMGFLLALIIARYFGASGLGDYVLAIIVFNGRLPIYQRIGPAAYKADIGNILKASNILEKK